MLFSNIIGQQAVKDRLLMMAKANRVPHALMFTGKEGVGKLPLALAFIQYLCCENKTETDSCGKCPSCQQISKLMHPDLNFVYPFAKSESCKTGESLIAEWRELVTSTPYFSYDKWMQAIGTDKVAQIYASESEEISRKLALKSFESDYKFMVIWHSEKMNETCANKILKMLEEPQGKTLFVLISDHPEKHLTTILSRVQKVVVPPLSSECLKEKLKENYEVTDDEADEIARISNGSYTFMVDWLNNEGSRQESYDFFVQFMRAAYVRDMPKKREWVKSIERKGREFHLQFLRYAQEMVRESFVANYQQQQITYTTPQEGEFLQRFAQFINERNVTEIMNEFSYAESHIALNGNAFVVLSDLLLRITVLIRK